MTRTLLDPASRVDIDGTTEHDAHARALARWPGRGAFVEKSLLDFHAPYHVGYLRDDGAGPRRVIIGRGLTWERAFLSADKRESTPRKARRRAACPPRRETVKQLDCFGGAHGCASGNT